MYGAKASNNKMAARRIQVQIVKLDKKILSPVDTIPSLLAEDSGFTTTGCAYLTIGIASIILFKLLLAHIF